MCAISDDNPSIRDIIKRYYTKALEGSDDKTVYDLFGWKSVDVLLKDYKSGQIIFDMKGLSFPEHYSQSACDIIASKYFRKAGVNRDNDGLDYEHSLRQVIHRMVSFWVSAIQDVGLELSYNEVNILYDELAYMMLSQMWAPNSPQWFNTGLAHVYGITGAPQGHWYYDRTQGAVIASKDAYTRTQASACFILSVKDSLIGEQSLMDTLQIHSLIFKYGSGAGQNWSSIRGKGEKLSGGGKSSGLMSFLRVFDRNGGSIKSGGTTRRAACINILNADHPEILEFINWKAHEEDKVRALGKMGYDTGFDGEAYDTVSGQNANNSVRYSNEFMDGVLKGDSFRWYLRNRVDGDITLTDGMEIWKAHIKAAWKCGDPAIQFDDIINDWHTCPSGSDGKYNAPYNRINSSNPCIEYMFLDNTACNLASINLLQLYDSKSNQFDLSGYLHCISLITVALEATIEGSHFPTKEIAYNTHKFRSIGIGFTNLGALLMTIGVPYDSEEGRNTGALLASFITGQTYKTSALIAKEIGAFECFEANKPHMLRVIKNHLGCANGDPKLLEGLNYNPFCIEWSPEIKSVIERFIPNAGKALQHTWRDARQYGDQYGYRNAQVSLSAPTGTISLALDCATTGSEPFFSHITYKKLVGGSLMEQVNPVIRDALNNLGYTAAEQSEITDYIMRRDDNGYILDGNIENAPYLKDEHKAIFDTANRCGTGKRFIHHMGHVRMMAAIQPHISGAQSRTVNLPNDASLQDVSDIYTEGYRLGLKSIAIYRDKSKASQILTTHIKEQKSNDYDSLTYQELIDELKRRDGAKPEPVTSIQRARPEGILRANRHPAWIGELKLYIIISYYPDSDKIAEVFVEGGKQGSLVRGLLDDISTTMSKMLQYGIPASEVAKMYRGQNYAPNGYVGRHPYIKTCTSITDLVSKVLDIELGDYSRCQVKPESYIQPEEMLPIRETDDTVIIRGEHICSNCHGDTMVKSGTCYFCRNCGVTTGCS